MSKPHSHIEIALASIQVFGNDGALDLAELERLLVLAQRDRAIDEDEKRVLGNVFRQAELGALDPVVRARIEQVRSQHGIPA